MMALLEAQETKALIMLLLWLHMDDGLLEAQETVALMILSRSCGCTC